MLVSFDLGFASFGFVFLHALSSAKKGCYQWVRNFFPSKLLLYCCQTTEQNYSFNLSHISRDMWEEMIEKYERFYWIQPLPSETSPLTIYPVVYVKDKIAERSKWFIQWMVLEWGHSLLSPWWMAMLMDKWMNEWKDEGPLFLLACVGMSAWAIGRPLVASWYNYLVHVSFLAYFSLQYLLILLNF